MQSHPAVKWKVNGNIVYEPEKSITKNGKTLKIRSIIVNNNFVNAKVSCNLIPS